MKRTRLSPEDRREQILNVAKESIFENGLQQFSLKQLAVDGGVSEPLLFHYFSSRIDLLQQLLSRDFNRYLDALNKSLDESSTLDEITRVYVARNFNERAERGVIDILLAEAEIAVAINERRTTNARQREMLLVGTLAKELGISRKKAAMLASMASAASIAAAKFAHEEKLDRDDAIDTVMQFIDAAFEAAKTQ